MITKHFFPNQNLIHAPFPSCPFHSEPEVASTNTSLTEARYGVGWGGCDPRSLVAPC